MPTDESPPLAEHPDRPSSSSRAWDWVDPSEMPASAQLILGADKRNPLFSIYHDTQREKLLVYYGLELMEALPDAADSPAYKLMVARLYNARLKAKSLCETFGVDLKTIQRWARALRSGDARQLLNVLEGSSTRRKLTPEVEAFARIRWPEIAAHRSYGAGKRLREEIKAVFRVSISEVTLRPLIRELKTQSPSSVAPSTPGNPTSHESMETNSSVEVEVCAVVEATLATGPSDGEGPVEKRESPFGSSLPDSTVQDPSKPLHDNPIDPSIPAKPPADNPKLPPVFYPELPEGSHWSEHAGLLIFATPLREVFQLFPSAQGILSQWLASLWLGALNIEQTKFLCWEDLERLLGSVVRFPTPQREELKTLATDQTVEELLRFNLAQTGEGSCADFYFDPHSKHYTGEQNVLKGWCPKIRWADKVLHSDFIHTASGAPVYFETTDNFEDMRTRFFSVIARARSILKWPSERVVSYVVDRGIFGGEVFEKVLQDPSFHLITWQKGFLAQAWDSAQATGQMAITRTRNSSTDVRSYHFEYLDRDWLADPRLRQIVVQAIDPKGRTIQVAILTDDRKRGAPEILRLMFQRWLQENDFKYLDKHFGINQITSYGSVAYEDLRKEVQDREVKSAERKAIEARRASAHAQQAKLLLIQEKADFANRKRKQQCSELETQLCQLGADAKAERSALAGRISRLQAAAKRHEKSSLQRRQQIDSWNEKLEALATELEATAPKGSRLEELIGADMVRMEPKSKRLLDTLRILARNQFYKALRPFKAAYNNYRDDHDYFRQLTRSPGVLEVGPQSIRIHLFPKSTYSREMKRIVKGVLEGINQEGLKHPTKNEFTLKFRLAQRSEMKVKMEIQE